MSWGNLDYVTYYFISSPLLLLISHFEYPRPPIEFYTVGFIYYFRPCFGLYHNIISLPLQHNEL